MNFLVGTFCGSCGSGCDMQALRWFTRPLHHHSTASLFNSHNFNIFPSLTNGFYNSALKNNGVWNRIGTLDSGMVPLGRHFQCTISSEDRAAMKKIVELATPKFVNGTWRKPYLSKRKVAMLRKKFFVEGRPWPEIPKPFDVANRIPKPPKPPKGHKLQRKGVKLARLGGLPLLVKLTIISFLGP